MKKSLLIRTNSFLILIILLTIISCGGGGGGDGGGGNNDPSRAGGNECDGSGDRVLKLIDLIECGKIPNNLSNYDELTKDILSQEFYNSPFFPDNKIVAFYVKKGGTGQGTSWDDATSDLQGVIDESVSRYNFDVKLILIAADSEPYEFGEISFDSPYGYIFQNYGMIGGFSAESDNLELDAENRTILSGQQTNKVISAYSLVSSVFYNIDIQDGSSDYGGGMRLDEAFAGFSSQNIWLKKINFSNNRSSILGGGISINKSRNIYLSEVKFINNSASDSGGGIFSSSNDHLMINNSKFINNFANEQGGGIYTYDSSGLYNSVTFIDNSSDIEGGALHLAGIPILHINNASFLNNKSTLGGAISGIVSNVVISHATVKGNHASKGGGIYSNNDNRQLSLEFINSIIWDNSADETGDQIYLHDNSNDSNVPEVIKLSNVVLQGGIEEIGSINSESSAGIDTKVTHVIKTDPSLIQSTDSDGEIIFTLAENSNARDQGFFIKMENIYLDYDDIYLGFLKDYYFSRDEIYWYRYPDYTNGRSNDTEGMLTSGTFNLPPDLYNLTEFDLSGVKRDRPDLGAFEFQ